MSDPYLGEIRAVAFGFAPYGWALCNGAILPIAQNQALFTLLGTVYGGNGTQTFGLPDLQGRRIVGVGQGLGLPPYIQGQKSGNVSVTLTNQQLPTHTHVATFTPSGGGGTPAVTVNIQGSSATAGTNVAAGNYISGAPPLTLGAHGTQTTSFVSAPAANTLGNLAGVTATISGVAGGGGTVTNALTGSGLPFEIEDPYLAIYYIIATQGIFPTRG